MPRWSEDAVDELALGFDGSTALEAAQISDELKFVAWGGKAGEVPIWARKLASATIVSWILAVPVCLVLALRFEDATSLEFDLPDGMPSFYAGKAMARFFPSTSEQTLIAFYLESREGAPDVGPDNSVVRAWSNQTTQLILNNRHALALSTSVLWYYNTEENELVRSQLLSESKRATVLVLQLAHPGEASQGGHLVKLVEFLRTLDRSSVPQEDYFLGLTGEKVISMDSRDGTSKDALMSEMFTFPVAFLILACFIRRWSMMWIPVCTIVVCLSGAFALCYLVTFLMRVNSLAPSLIESVVLAFNVDYNLFLLTRFLESRAHGQTLWDNVVSLVLNTAAETVAISGFLVSLAFFALGFIPVEPLLGFGSCAGLAVLTCVFVNCTLTPALLLLCGDAAAGIHCRRRHGRPSTVLDASFEIHKQERSAIFRCSKHMAECPAVVLFCVLLGGIPLYIHLPQAFSRTTVDPFEITPMAMESVITFRQVMSSSSFHPGMFSPFQLLLVAKPVLQVSHGSACFSPEGYQAMQWLLSVAGEDVDFRHAGAFYGPTSMPVKATKMVDSRLIETMRSSCGPFQKVCDVVFDYIDNKPSHVDFHLANMILTTPIPDNPLKISDPLYRNATAILQQAHYIKDAYTKVFHEMVSQSFGHPAMMTQVWLPYNPFGNRADEWMRRMDFVLDEFRGNPMLGGRFEVHLYNSQTSVLHDFNISVQNAMPKVLASLLLAVCIIVLITFRSIPLALLMGVTILYSVGVSLGMSYLIFQTDKFHWLFPFLAGFNEEGLSWVVLPMITSIMVALAMDYDVFILTRAMEIRGHNFKTDAAALKAVYAVGPTIAGAGLIMAVAFGGLMSTSVVCLVQFGVCLFVSVLVDAFLMATVLVPMALHICGRHIWWPSPGLELSWREEGLHGVEVLEESVQDPPGDVSVELSSLEGPSEMNRVQINVA